MELNMSAQRFLIGLILLTSMLPAHAQERLFPPIAKRGTLQVGMYHQLTLDGKPRRLSVGGWIKNEKNTIDLTAKLQGREFVVNYTENQQGEIDRVWILSSQEVLKAAPSERPENQQIISQ